MKNNYIKKTIQLIFFAFVAKGLGFVREMVLANYYGANYVSDVFVVVQNIPAVIFAMFGTAVTTGFIPLYSELKVKNGKSEAHKFMNNVFNIFFFVAIVLTVLGIVFSKELVLIFAGGFSGKTYALCNQFAKIIMPSSIAIILVYVYNAYLQTEGYFNQNSLMNVPYNVIQILCIMAAFYIKNIYLLAIGILLSSFGQLFYLKFLMARKTNFKHKIGVKFNDPTIIKMLILVGPVFISTAINQLNTIIDRSLASGLIEGSASALNYANEVTNIVTQVIILSLTTILYPKLTELYAQNSNDKNEFTENYIQIVSLLVFPLSAIIFVLSKEIVQILFGRGAFTEETVLFVSRALKIYALGIAGASFRDVLNKVFYAMKNTVIPMINGGITVCMNIILNLLLIRQFKYLGLAAATAIAATVCTILLMVQLMKKNKDLKLELLIKTMCKHIIATVIMFIISQNVYKFIFIENAIIKFIFIGVIAVVVYIGILIIIKESVVIKTKDNLINRIRGNK